MTPSLPTCWYCPECGWSAAYDVTGDHETAAGECGGEMIEIPMIPPGTPPEQILNLVGEVSVMGSPPHDGWFMVEPRDAT